MSLLARPAVAAFAAKAMQRLAALANRRAGGPGSTAAWQARLPEYACATRELTVPTAYGPARAVLYLPAEAEGTPPPPVHVNFHGGGYVMPQIELDDALCRCIAVVAGVAVLNVDYVVAPQHPFPAPPRQAFEVVRWAAEHGGEIRHCPDGSEVREAQRGVTEQEPGKRERDAAAREARVRIGRVRPVRVDDGEGMRQLRRHAVMVRDEHVDAGRIRAGNLRDAR